MQPNRIRLLAAVLTIGAALPSVAVGQAAKTPLRFLIASEGGFDQRGLVTAYGGALSTIDFQMVTSRDFWHRTGGHPEWGRRPHHQCFPDGVCRLLGTTGDHQRPLRQTQSHCQPGRGASALRRPKRFGHSLDQRPARTLGQRGRQSGGKLPAGAIRAGGLRTGRGRLHRAPLELLGLSGWAPQRKVRRDVPGWQLSGPRSPQGHRGRGRTPAADRGEAG